MQAEALFAPSPVRGQLEPQDEANRPGYLYLQCTDTPNELKVLLPPRPAFLYSQLIIAELATLSNREAIDWNKLLRIRHLKDRMIRKCLRLERQMAPRRKLDGISFIALPAPETFRLKELERWYQDWELEQDALGEGDYMPTTPPKKQATPELRRGSTCCERCAHAPPPASPTPSQRASRRTSMASMQRGSMIISPGPPVAYADHHHHAHHHHHHHHHHPPEMDDTSPSPNDDDIHHQEEFYHDHGQQEYTPQPMPPPPPPEPQHDMSPTPLPESQMQLQSEFSPTPMPEPPMHLHGAFSPDPIPIPYRQSAAIENPMSLSYLASQLRDSPSPQPPLGATPMSPILEDPASLIDETPQPLPVPMPAPIPVPEPIPHRTGIPRRRSSLKRSNSTISLPKTVAWADLSDQMARVGLAAGAADDEGGKNFEAVKAVIMSQLTGLGSLRQNIASSLDQLRMKTEILQKEAERLLQDEESMREKERQLQMTLESLELRHTERQ